MSVDFSWGVRSANFLYEGDSRSNNVDSVFLKSKNSTKNYQKILFGNLKYKLFFYINQHGWAPIVLNFDYIQGVSFKTQPWKDAHALSTEVGKENKPDSQCVSDTPKEIA